MMGVTSPGFRGRKAAAPHFVLPLQGRLGVPGCSLLLALGETPQCRGAWVRWEAGRWVLGAGTERLGAHQNLIYGSS